MRLRRQLKPMAQRRQQLDTTWWGDARPRQQAGRPLFGAAESVWPKVLLALMALTILYLPNVAQLNLDMGLRGINPANILFILILGALWMSGYPASEPTPLKLPLVLFCLVLTYSLLQALVGDSSAWVEDVTVWKNGIFYLLLYFLFFHAVRDMKTVRILMLVLMFVLFTSSVLGVRQAIDYGIGTFNENKRVAAPFGWSVFDANRSAVFFCIFTMVAVSGALFLERRPWLRLTLVVIVILCVVTIFHTYSRQSYFILAILILLLAVRKHLLLAVLAATLLFNYQLWVPNTVMQRIEMTTVDPFDTKVAKSVPMQTFEASLVSNGPLYGQVAGLSYEDPFRPAVRTIDSGAESDQQYDESTESRFTLWSGAWELISTRPAGIGMNRFQREITPHVPPSLAGKDAHNFYVLLATEAGIFAPLFLIGLMGSLLWLGHRLAALGADDEARALGVGFSMATLAVMLGNVYGSRFLDGDVMGVYWLLAALTARTLVIKERELRERKMALEAARAIPQRSVGQGHVASPSRFPATSSMTR